jgi:hypothetical protein
MAVDVEKLTGVTRGTAWICHRPNECPTGAWPKGDWYWSVELIDDSYEPPRIVAHDEGWAPSRGDAAVYVTNMTYNRPIPQMTIQVYT